jgi:hypothetical protein
VTTQNLTEIQSLFSKLLEVLTSGRDLSVSITVEIEEDVWDDDDVCDELEQELEDARAKLKEFGLDGRMSVSDELELKALLEARR